MARAAAVSRGASAQPDPMVKMFYDKKFYEGGSTAPRESASPAGESMRYAKA